MLSFAFAAVLAAANALAQSVSITGLGDLPGGKFRSRANSVSADGRVVVGESYVDDSFIAERAFRWTRAGGMENLGKLADVPGYSTAKAISADGNWIVGSSHSTRGFEAFRRSPTGEMEGLGAIIGGPVVSHGTGVSNDGRTAIGYAFYAQQRTEAFRWREGEGMQGLGFLGGQYARSSAAYAMSPDGSRIVGVSSYGVGEVAFLWTEETGMVSLGGLTTDYPSSTARDISDDGRVVVGQSSLNGRGRAFVWTQDGGMVPIAPTNEWGPITRATGVNADGSIVIGTGQLGEIFSFVWTPSAGYQILEDYLLRFGLDVTAQGWTRLQVSDITPNGRFIVGEATNPNGDQEAFLIEIPAPSVASLMAFASLVATRRRR